MFKIRDSCHLGGIDSASDKTSVTNSASRLTNPPFCGYPVRQQHTALPSILNHPWLVRCKPYIGKWGGIFFEYEKHAVLVNVIGFRSVTAIGKLYSSSARLTRVTIPAFVSSTLSNKQIFCTVCISRRGKTPCSGLKMAVPSRA